MARNEEKHYGKLNRLYLMKEKEEHEKANPKRPRLDTLDSPEEVQKWLPSIKKDIDFYLKKSQVTCYSDVHVEDCREKVVKLEKEFKAFVRKIKQLTPSPLEVIPWTSRPYKRKKSGTSEKNRRNEFIPIATPILDNEKCDTNSDITTSENEMINLDAMNEPLQFSFECKSDKQSTAEHCTNQTEKLSRLITSDLNFVKINNSIDCKKTHVPVSWTNQVGINPYFKGSNVEQNNVHARHIVNIVNYDSSDDENS